MSDFFTPQPVRGKKGHNAEAPDTQLLGVLPAVASGTVPAYTEGNSVLLSTDTNGRLRVILGGTEGDSGAMDVDVTDRAGRLVGVVSLDAATLSALESVDLNSATLNAITTALESVDLNSATITAITSALESVDLNTATLNALTTRLDGIDTSVDATTTAVSNASTAIVTALDSVTLDAATLSALESVDLNAATVAEVQKVFVRGAQVSDSNPLPVTIEANPGTVVDSGLLTSANVAAGASVDLNSTAVASGTGKLLELTTGASVRTRVEVKTVSADGLTIVSKRVFFVDANESFVYRTADKDAVTIAAGGSFRATIKNMDNLQAADVYASVTHLEV